MVASWAVPSSRLPSHGPAFLVLVAFAAWTVGLGGARRAQAQGETVDVQVFHPTAGPGATFQIDRPEVLRHRTFLVGVGAGYANGLLRREEVDGTLVAIAPHRADLDLMMSLGLFEVLQLGVALPLVLVHSPDDALASPVVRRAHLGTSDMRLSVKFPIVRGDFAIAGQLLATAPTATAGQLSGLGRWSFRPSVILAYTRGRLRVSGEVGWNFRDRHALGSLEIDDELTLLAGASYSVTRTVALIGEVSSRLGLTGRTRRPNEMPTEVDLGARFTPTTHLSFDVGAGTGIVAGYGSPLVRGFFVLRYTNEDEPCAEGPEDFDGFEDGDYCRDVDDDADGIEDDDDACRNDAEDIDGFLDGDGCPELDNDADGLEDAVDRCPNQTEDADGYLDEDGCPEPDNDEDGIPDGLDDCPLEPEDADSFQDEDGCPEPGPRPSVVTITDTRILISERIYFDYESEVIRSVSFPLLDQVAAVILELPARKRIRVEGYSDSDGDERYNLDLSYRRARSVVEYLAAHGVPMERLAYAGYGEARPVAPNDSVEGRALNRRVEFTILEPEDGTSRSGGGEAGGEGRRRRRGR